MSYNRPDVAVIDREENTWYIVDFAIPVDTMLKKRTRKRLISIWIWQLRLEGFIILKLTDTKVELIVGKTSSITDNKLDRE